MISAKVQGEDKKKACTVSGGFSNLGARGKNFQKLMLSKKKELRSWLPLFSPKLMVASKKKRSPLQFHL